MKQYRLVAYIRVDPENQEPMSYEEVLSEKAQQEFLFPENIYRIEEIEPAQGKEAPCIPPGSRKN